MTGTKETKGMTKATKMICRDALHASKKEII